MNKDFSEILKKRNIKSSHQRIKILEYLASHPCHPYAEQIYDEIKKEIPTISMSTVYSTLNAFVDGGILREITIEDSRVRYEYNLKNHGHFKCEICGNVYDFDINISNVPLRGLDGFEIKEKDVFFKGVCEKCSGK